MNVSLEVVEQDALKCALRPREMGYYCEQSALYHTEGAKRDGGDVLQFEPQLRLVCA